MDSQSFVDTLPFARPAARVAVEGVAAVPAPGLYRIQALVWDRAGDCADPAFTYTPTGELVSWVLVNAVTGERVPVAFHADVQPRSGAV